MCVSHKALYGRHMTTDFCGQVAERKWRRLAEEEAFTAYGIHLVPVTYFRYLGRVLTVHNDDCLIVVRNLRKARRKWERLTRVLGREGADAQTLGYLYLAVVQSVLLYRS